MQIASKFIVLVMLIACGSAYCDSVDADTGSADVGPVGNVGDGPCETKWQNLTIGPNTLPLPAGCEASTARGTPCARDNGTGGVCKETAVMFNVGLPGMPRGGVNIPTNVCSCEKK